MYKKGDRVKVIRQINFPENGEYYLSQNISVGNEYTLCDDFENNVNGRYWTFVDKNTMDVSDKWAFEFQFELISNSDNVANKKMTLREKFLVSLKKEPEKSFRKAEITNGDDMLTEDGKNIFLSWLLTKNGADFKKEVIDEILSSEKEDSLKS